MKAPGFKRPVSNFDGANDTARDSAFNLHETWLLSLRHYAKVEKAEREGGGGADEVEGNASSTLA